MALTSGTRLGPYEISGPLGSGGMGEVYRARDTRLKRDVAVKVLPERLSRDPEALARFEREAVAVAALSHPGIVSIHDIGEADGVRFAVVELLEGESLRSVVLRGPLPPARALEVAREVAEALASAHEKGIVHRDVKPENVFLTKDGHAKLLDFGLARVEDSASAEADGRFPTAALTDADVLLGTVSYMSPEQARGLPVDHRSDQFSLGVTLYELLSGRRPFCGASRADTLAAILREEPLPLSAAAPWVPAPVRWLVERCLAKDPAERWDTTRDLARELRTIRLDSAAERLPPGATPSGTGPGRRRSSPRTLLAAAAGAVLLFTVVQTASLRRGTRNGTAPVARFEVTLPEGWFLSPYSRALDLSPDGRLLVFSAFARKEPLELPGEALLFLRSLDDLEARPLAGTEGAVMPAFSPDGRHVAFASSANGKPALRRIPVAGGPVETVCACEAAYGLAWGPDGKILHAGSEGPLFSVPSTGGRAEPATTLDTSDRELSHRLPSLLPDGRTVVYTALRAGAATRWERARLWAGRAGESERSLLAEGGSDGRFSPPGHLVFARNGALLAAPFDPEARRLTGTPVVVLAAVRHSIRTTNLGLETGAAHVAISRGGLLAWSPGSVTPPVVRAPAWVDRSGRETPVEGAPADAPVLSLRVSAEGRRVLFTYSYPGYEAEVLDLDRGGRQRVTFGANPPFAIWGPGRDAITYTSGHVIFTRRLDAGPDEAETLWEAPANRRPLLGSWSRDGRVLAFVMSSPDTANDVWLLERGREPHPFAASRFNEASPDLSPDGRWLLYSSWAPGRAEVLARPVEADGGIVHVSTDGGTEPLWSRDGRSVYYWKDLAGSPDRTLYRVPVAQREGSLAFGVPERLFASSISTATPGHGWDVAPDGRFLVRKRMPDQARHAWWSRLLSNRLLVDTGGVAHLLADAPPAP